MIHQDLSVVTMAGSQVHRVIHNAEFITMYILEIGIQIILLQIDRFLQRLDLEIASNYYL